MDQFFGLLVLGLIIWFIFMMRTRNKQTEAKSSSKPQTVSKGSTFHLDGENITVSLVGAKGNIRVSKFSVFEIETINLMKPTTRKNGMIQFVLNSGMITEPLEVDRSNRFALEEAMSEIERILENSSDPFSRTQPDASSSKPSVQFDGRLRTNELEFISIDEANPFEQAIIQLDNPEFAVVDVETTGLYPDGGDRIVEIAIVVIDSRGKLICEWSSIINPGRKVNSTQIHGLTDSDVSASPKFDEVAKKVFELISNKIFVAHNASFDYRFIRKELGAAGLEIEPLRFPVFDTMSLASKNFANIPNKKMESLLEAMELDLSTLPGRGAHSALTDAHACARILDLYLQNNRQAVLDAVSWPLLQAWTKPRILSSAEVTVLDNQKKSEAEFMTSLLLAPTEEIRIQKFSEVYFTGFMPEQEILIQQLTKKWEVTRAVRVTKKKCTLVVTADTQRASGAVKNAMKWDIPVVALQHASWVNPTA